MAVELEPRLFTVQEYHRLAATGVFDDEHVELLDGVIVRMSPLGLPHWSRHARILDYLFQTVRPYAQIHGQISLPLGERSEPEPDIAILADLPYEDLKRTPDSSEIYAMIEVADSSIARDTRTKRKLYARFSIRDYLVVDINRDVLLHYTQPLDGDYIKANTLEAGASFAIAALPSLALSADAFLRKR